MRNVKTGVCCFILERVIIMAESKIKLSDVKAVEDFVSAASRCDFDIDIFYNHFIIDAKSILGILSMDLSKTLTVHCYGEDQKFRQTLQKYSVA
jgi:phosphotransferase system HPr-like phosphotransfer protein